MLSKWKGRFAILAILALAATFLVALPAGANGDIDITTDAQIGLSGDDSPDIVCKWELPDTYTTSVPDDYEYPPVEGKATPNPGGTTPGMEYGNDDDSVDIAANPCRQDEFGTTKYFTDGSQYNVMQVEANPENYPSKRYIELWAAIRGKASVAAVDSVFWDIYHPDGSFKTQEYGVLAGRPEQYGATFNQGSWTLDQGYAGMWYAASELTGQIATDTLTGQSGIIARAAEYELGLFKGRFWLDKHQPCGEYEVRLYASNDGDTSTLSNTLSVLCFVELVTDFTTVDWGVISPGDIDVVYGDLLMDTPERPTVKNTGSGELSLGIEFTDMEWVEDGLGNPIETAGAKRITMFDAAFGTNPSYLVGFPELPAYQEGQFGNGYYQVLCANEVGKLDLSIHPPGWLPAGLYSGSIWLYAYNNPNDDSPCLNEAGDWQDWTTVRYPFGVLPPE
ncbi:MAG: hypothetical protein GXP35_14750 [Actinobacteria bacterium]|nr:hypothetical protein [Actinomycetota bacterium]